MWQILFENANTSEMKVVSSLLIDGNLFISLTIYNGRSYKIKYMNIFSAQHMKLIKMLLRLVAILDDKM